MRVLGWGFVSVAARHCHCHLALHRHVVRQKRRLHPDLMSTVFAEIARCVHVLRGLTPQSPVGESI